jgi:glycine/serine hydroxymethyltransferase
MPQNELEVHDPEVLARARALLDACQSVQEMQQAVLDAVARNEEWRGQRCINLLAPESPTSPTARTLLSSEVGIRAAEGHIGAVNRWLARANIITNKNLIPGDKPEDWDRPSGLRMGSIEVTRLGMREKEMETIADFMARILIEKAAPEDVMEDVVDFRLPYQTMYYCFDNGLLL